MARNSTTRFRNTTGGYIGVVKYKPNGEEHGVAVEPHGTVELTDEEIEATAQAPREAKDNPFTDQPFEIRDPNTDELIESGLRPLLVVDDETRVSPTQGSRGASEEVGDPEAEALGAESARGDLEAAAATVASASGAPAS